MRVFITGASGFIGKHIIQRLIDLDHELLLLTVDEESQKSMAVYTTETIMGNLDRIDSFQGALVAYNPEVCIHLAWQGIPEYSFATSKKNLDNSIELVTLLADRTDCKKLLISGSCYEYGHAAGACRESDPGETISYFAWAKKALHDFSRFVSGQASFDLLWFRIFYVYGPGQRPASLIPSLLAAFEQSKAPQLRSPLDAHDFVYVGDVAEAFCLAAIQPVEPGIYNLGTGMSTRVIDLCQEAEMVIQGSTPMTDGMLRGELGQQKTNFWADTTKAQNALQWSAKTSLREGIEQYLRNGHYDYFQNTVTG